MCVPRAETHSLTALARKFVGFENVPPPNMLILDAARGERYLWGPGNGRKGRIFPKEEQITMFVSGYVSRSLEGAMLPPDAVKQVQSELDAMLEAARTAADGAADAGSSASAGAGPPAGDTASAAGVGAGAGAGVGAGAGTGAGAGAGSAASASGTRSRPAAASGDGGAASSGDAEAGQVTSAPVPGKTKKTD